ncbi:DNA break repair nuclease [Dissophora globulifera]|nr:DNA break repair nuclease [Dissophora globulifera]
MDSHHRKHDLAAQLATHHNVQDQPPAKKRTISLRRPRTPSLPASDAGAGIERYCIAASASSVPAAASTCTQPNIAAAAAATTPTATAASSPPSPLTSATAKHFSKQDAQRAESSQTPEVHFTSAPCSQLWDSPAVPDCSHQEEHYLQKDLDSKTKDSAVTDRSERYYGSTQINHVAGMQEAEQPNDVASQGHANPAALESEAENGRREKGQAQVQDDDDEHDNDDVFMKTRITTYATCERQPSVFDNQPDPSNDPDCNENIQEDEFPDVDEIKTWDLDELQAEYDLSPSVGPALENACPVCGIDLASLDTMTPDAHVNRCLDGAEPVQAPEALETSVAGQSFSGAPLLSIVGTIRTAISNFPSFTNNSKDSSAAKKPIGNGSNKGTWKSKSRVPRPCPFYKKMPDTSFTVDAFCYGAIDGCDAYFLSHFHSDHYGGLTSSWEHGLIYCSSITANLVISRLRVDAQFVRRLPMYEPTIVNGVTVRLMDANHCPGSVLFVFDLEDPRRRYLHTGDFRASPDMCVDPILRQPQNVPIDILYLDTTYSNPRYTFPPQDLVIRETANLVCRELGLSKEQEVASVVRVAKRVNLMESWLKKESGNSEKLLSMSVKMSQSIKAKQRWQEPSEKNRIVICVGTYLIGKERVFKAIANAIKSKVFVQHSKLQILACLEDPELMEMLTSDRHEAQVHLLHMGSEMSPESLQDYLDSLAPTFTRLIAIRPTGWTFTGSKKFTSADTDSTDQPSIPTPTTLELKSSFTSPTVKIYPVPYSEHSSFNELAGFVRSLDVSKIIPTVGVGSEKGRHAMTEWFKRWGEERRQGIGWE